MIGLVSIIGLMKGLGLFLGDPAGASPAQAAQVADNLISPINTGPLLLVPVGVALLLVLVRFGVVVGDGAPHRTRVERRRNRTRAPPVAS